RHTRLVSDWSSDVCSSDLFNVIAFLVILAVTTVLVIGIKESANLNSAIVMVKLGVVAIFLVLGVNHLIHHPELLKANWHPFIPRSEERRVGKECSARGRGS